MTQMLISKFELTEEMDIVHVSSKGQIVIPEKIRKLLKIKEGSKLVLVLDQGSIILAKEKDVERILDEAERRETLGWMILASPAFREVWDNPIDEEVWKKYL